MTDLKTAGATLAEQPADKTAKPVAPEAAPVTQVAVIDPAQLAAALAADAAQDVGGGATLRPLRATGSDDRGS